MEKLIKKAWTCVQCTELQDSPRLRGGVCRSCRMKNLHDSMQQLAQQRGPFWDKYIAGQLAFVERMVAREKVERKNQ